VNAYPNPTTDAVQLNFTGADSGKAIVSLYSLDGKLLATHQVEINSNQKINLTLYPSGTYLLKIGGTNFEMVKRIVKQ
jgi:hypothetical protein